MTVRWQPIAIPLRSGVETKADEKTVGPAKLTVLENGVFTKAGAIRKRNGYAVASNKTDEATAQTITTANKLATRDNELLLFDDNSVYSYAEHKDRWVDKGAFEAPSVVAETWAKTASEQTLSDTAVAENIRILAWDDSRGTTRYSLWDESTGAVYANDTALEASSARPRCVNVNGVLYLIYTVISGNDLKCLKFVPGDIPTSLAASAVSLATDLNGTDAWYDVKECHSGTRAILAYVNTSNTATVGYLPEESANTLMDEVEVGQLIENGITVAQEPNTLRSLVAWEDSSAGGIWGIVLNEELGAVTPEFQIQVGAGDITSITAAFEGTTTAEQSNTYALSLPGGEGAVADSNVPDLSGATDATLECWVYPTAIGTGGDDTYLIQRIHSAGSNYQYVLGYDSSGVPFVQFSNATPTLLTWTFSGVTISTNAWTHICVTLDISEADEDLQTEIYINGVFVENGDGTTAIASIRTADGDLNIGSNGDVDKDLTGYLDMVRIWSVRRTATEIAASYRRIISAGSRGLLAEYRFEFDLNDSVGQAHLTHLATAAYTTSVPFAAGDGANNFLAHVFWTIGATDDKTVHKATASTYGATPENDAGATSNWWYHAGLASHAWLRNGDVYVNLVHASDLQTTYFTVRDDKTIVTRSLPSIAGGHPSTSHLPSVQSTSGGYVWAGHYKRRLDTTAYTIDDGTPDENEVYTELGCKLLTINWDGAQAREGVQQGHSTYFAGGFLQQYDGQGMVEAGFHLYPEGVTAAASSASGSLANSTTYAYRVYWEWTNAQGERERSTGLIITKATGGSDDTITLTIKTLTFTAKQGSREDVSIVIYRTEGTPTINSPFYRASSLDPSTAGSANGYLANDPDDATGDVTWVDKMADTTLTAKELDYQNTGELDNVPPATASIVARGKDRLWLAGLDDPNQIQYSKLRFPGDVVSFNDALTLQCDQDGGAITAIAPMNEAMIVFKRRRIFVITGEGPNNFGFGGFSDPQLVVSDTGCKDARSIVMTPLGLMFQSDKGIYLLSQQYQLSYIGAPVEAYNAQTVTSAELVADRNQARFLTDSGKTLLYDYLFQQWSTFTNHEGVDAAVWKNTYVYARSNGRLYKESGSEYTDGGQPYRLKMRTGWLRLSGLQGYQRVRRLHVLGEFKSTHSLLVDIEYDYEVTDALYRASFGASSVISSSTYGDGATYGADDPYGGSDESVYQFRIRLPRQKCQSVRFTFQDSPGTTIGESYEINELALEVGLKSGHFRLPSGKTVST